MARMVVNIGSLRTKVSKAIKNKTPQGFKRRAIDNTQRQFAKEKRRFISQFLSHEITTDILFGTNSAGTLSKVNGSLFGFIGFDEGDDPIGELERVIRDSVGVNPASLRMVGEDGRSVFFEVKTVVPTESLLRQATPMPWAGGKSWLFGIEREGISGLGRFIPDYSGEGSRSGQGIQASRKDLRNATFKKKDYVLKLVKLWRERKI